MGHPPFGEWVRRGLPNILLGQEPNRLVRADLKAIYSAATEEASRAALAGFGEKRDSKCPAIFRRWERHWDDLREFFKRPPEIRQAIYATNAAESLNCQLRKAAKNRSAFCADDAMLKILCLAIRNASKKWTMPIREWGQDAA